jgi:hypothetical protein
LSIRVRRCGYGSACVRDFVSGDKTAQGVGSGDVAATRRKKHSAAAVAARLKEFRPAFRLRLRRIIDLHEEVAGSSAE